MGMLGGVQTCGASASESPFPATALCVAIRNVAHPVELTASSGRCSNLPRGNDIPDLIVFNLVPSVRLSHVTQDWG